MSSDVAAQKFWVVIPAAGSGRRMGGAERPKQYLSIAGRALIEWAVAPFLRHAGCVRIVVALAADDPYWTHTSLSSSERIATTLGGGERADSVYAGLEFLRSQAQPDDWVLVHDAARPCLSDEDLASLLDELRGDAVGGLLAAPVVDTLKKSDAAGRVEATVPRQQLWRALTPQMFRFDILHWALRSARERGVVVTDEAQAVELLGLQPRLIAGSVDNLKVTTRDDLERAKRILAACSAAKGHS
jgi:2-C-methyl-D-erythritol 4-phosphate cytidylyltransferase